MLFDILSMIVAKASNKFQFNISSRYKILYRSSKNIKACNNNVEI